MPLTHKKRLNILGQQLSMACSHQKFCPMPMNQLGKLLFPRLPAWQARRQARQLFGAFVFSVIFGVAVAAVILYVNHKR